MGVVPTVKRCPPVGRKQMEEGEREEEEKQPGRRRRRRIEERTEYPCSVYKSIFHGHKDLLPLLVLLEGLQ